MTAGFLIFNSSLPKKLTFACILATSIGLTLGYQNCSKQNFYLSSSPITNSVSNPSAETIEELNQNPVNSAAVLEAIDSICESNDGQPTELPYSEVGLVCSGEAPCPSGFNCGPCNGRGHCNGDAYLFPYQANALVKYKFPPQTPLNYSISNFGCQTNLEVNNIRGEVLTFQSSLPQGSEERVLQIDVATYVAADVITISASNILGQSVNLLQTCRMRTACYGDPTDGKSRPPEDSIRTFRVTLPAGTKTITLDYLKSKSNTYTRIIGLCDFNLESVPTAGRIRSKITL